MHDTILMHDATSCAPGHLADRERKSSSTADRFSVQRRLLAATSVGSSSALHYLHFVYFSSLARFFAHLTSGTELIDELVADTLLDVWRASATIAREPSVLVSIMRLAWANARARLGDASPPPTFEGLSLAERAVVHLVHVGHSRPEVAEILGISDEAVDAELSAARTALRSWLTSPRDTAPSAGSAC